MLLNFNPLIGIKFEFYDIVYISFYNFKIIMKCLKGFKTNYRLWNAILLSCLYDEM